jgi:hypothetical protein
MRIKDLRLHPIAIADPPLRSSYGLHAPFALRTIVEILTDDGLTGISETYGGDGPVAALEAVREDLMGRDPFQIASFFAATAQKAEKELQDTPGGRSHTYLLPGENPLDRHTRTYATSSGAASATRFPSRPISSINMAGEAGSATMRARMNTARSWIPTLVYANAGR